MPGRSQRSVHFLSCEPLIGALDIKPWLILPQHIVRPGSVPVSYLRVPTLDWVIVGGESGTNARPMHPDWVRIIVNDCEQAGVPVLFKQWGEWIPKSHTTRRHQWHADQVPDDGNWRVEVTGRESWGCIDMDGNFSISTTCWNGHDDDDHGEAYVLQVGKHKAGRLLDNQIYDQYPEVELCQWLPDVEVRNAED